MISRQDVDDLTNIINSLECCNKTGSAAAVKHASDNTGIDLLSVNIEIRLIVPHG